MLGARLAETQYLGVNIFRGETRAPTQKLTTVISWKKFYFTPV